MKETVFLKQMTAEMYHAYYREYQNAPDLFLDKSQCKPFVYTPEWVDAYIRRQADKGRKCFAVKAGDEMAGELIINAPGCQLCGFWKPINVPPGSTNERASGQAAESTGTTARWRKSSAQEARMTDDAVK